MFRPEHIREILNDPALKWAFAEVEKTTLEQAILATSDEARARLLAEVRAMRSALGKLALVASGQVTPKGDAGA